MPCSQGGSGHADGTADCGVAVRSDRAVDRTGHETETTELFAAPWRRNRVRWGSRETDGASAPHGTPDRGPGRNPPSLFGEIGADGRRTKRTSKTFGGTPQGIRRSEPGESGRAGREAAPRSKEQGKYFEVGA